MYLRPPLEIGRDANKDTLPIHEVRQSLDGFSERTIRVIILHSRSDAATGGDLEGVYSNVNSGSGGCFGTGSPCSSKISKVLSVLETEYFDALEEETYQ